MGLSGYDPNMEDMQGIFLAQGPGEMVMMTMMMMMVVVIMITCMEDMRGIFLTQGPGEMIWSSIQTSSALSNLMLIRSYHRFQEQWRGGGSNGAGRRLSGQIFWYFFCNVPSMGISINHHNSSYRF